MTNGLQIVNGEQSPPRDFLFPRLEDRILTAPKVVVNGREIEVDFPPINAGDYFVRLMQPEDFKEVASFQDCSLAEKLTENKLHKMTQQGYSFEPQNHGLVGFVAVNKRTREIMGRTYLETWHSKDFIKPKYRLTESGGIEVISADRISQGGSRLLELGGWLVKPEHRRKGVGQALTYGSLAFIQEMERMGYSADLAFVSWVGALRSKDNPQEVDYRNRILKEISRKQGRLINLGNLSEVANQGEILTKNELDQIFEDFPGHRLADPRLTSKGAYQISNKLTTRSPLIINGETTQVSPYLFHNPQVINPNFGGGYVIKNLQNEQYKS